MEQIPEPPQSPEKTQASQNDVLALETVASAIVQEWKRRAQTNTAWADYSFVVNAFAEAIRRAPLTLEACDAIDRTSHLYREFALLSDVLLCLFPDGMM